MRYKLIDCKPVPAKLYDELLAIKNATGGVLTSCARNQAAVSYARGQGCQLSSQAELYNGFVQGRPGFNPANPPGYSTHEFRSDGVAFAIPRGLPIRYWMVGQDWGTSTGARAAVAAARARGWVATITYPTNPRELHHVNFRREPRLKVFRALNRGTHGRRVRKLRRALGFVQDPDNRKPYLPNPKNYKYFGEVTEDAVKRFQHDHGLKADGIYGYHTHKQLRVSVRKRKERLRERK